MKGFASGKPRIRDNQLHNRPSIKLTSLATRHFQPVALQRAAQEEPMLAQLIAKGQRSAAQLKAIDKLLPDALRSSVSAGPIDDGVWCLLVKGNGVAAKLRQLLPAFEAHLRSRGFETVSIRLKVSTQARGH